MSIWYKNIQDTMKIGLAEYLADATTDLSENVGVPIDVKSSFSGGKITVVATLAVPEWAKIKEDRVEAYTHIPAVRSDWEEKFDGNVTTITYSVTPPPPPNVTKTKDKLFEIISKYIASEMPYARVNGSVNAINSWDANGLLVGLKDDGFGLEILFSDTTGNYEMLDKLLGPEAPEDRNKRSDMGEEVLQKHLQRKLDGIAGAMSPEAYPFIKSKITCGDDAFGFMFGWGESFWAIIADYDASEHLE